MKGLLSGALAAVLGPVLPRRKLCRSQPSPGCGCSCGPSSCLQLFSRLDYFRPVGLSLQETEGSLGGEREVGADGNWVGRGRQGCGRGLGGRGGLGMEGKLEDGRECGAAESSAVLSPSALEGSDLTQEPLEHLRKCGVSFPQWCPPCCGVAWLMAQPGAG